MKNDIEKRRMHDIEHKSMSSDISYRPKYSRRSSFEISKEMQMGESVGNAMTYECIPKPRKNRIIICGKISYGDPSPRDEEISRDRNISKEIANCDASNSEKNRVLPSKRKKRKYGGRESKKMNNPPRYSLVRYEIKSYQ